MTRTRVAGARRLVVKVGSSSLASPAGGLDCERVDALVAAVAERRHAGAEVVLVSSGAIAAGLAPLGLRRRPRDLATLQAAASVGQGLLVERYAAAFATHGLRVGQVLLTAEDVIRRAHYRNARTTLDRLLELGVVPVVNENDAVATEEIRVGDNDRLAALVSHLVRAELVVLLSDVAGVYDRDPRHPDARLLPEIRAGAPLPDLGGAGSAVGSGGMATKVKAARLAASAGAVAVVAGTSDVARVLRGEPVGTVFPPSGRHRPARLLWLAYASTPRGRLVLDDGAVEAVVRRRLSLLPAGVVAVEGEFDVGDPVELAGETGVAVARGLVAYGSQELPALLGRSTRGSRLREVVHRDDIVLM